MDFRICKTWDFGRYFPNEGRHCIVETLKGSVEDVGPLHVAVVLDLEMKEVLRVKLRHGPEMRDFISKLLSLLLFVEL